MCMEEYIRVLHDVLIQHLQYSGVMCVISPRDKVHKQLSLEIYRGNFEIS